MSNKILEYDKQFYKKQRENIARVHKLAKVFENDLHNQIAEFSKKNNVAIIISAPTRPRRKFNIITAMGIKDYSPVGLGIDHAVS